MTLKMEPWARGMNRCRVPPRGYESKLTHYGPEDAAEVLGAPTCQFASEFDAGFPGGGRRVGFSPQALAFGAQRLVRLAHQVHGEVSDDSHVFAPCPLRSRDWSSLKETSRVQWSWFSISQ
jgi:hypothetical protein